ncbi:hypothetical protein KIS4809_2005 [Bacillus sp. ZZV12-4809]|nr:hypothetical protein KIS4809_2005 [Bacillus sp. ZZV12-4809]
MLWKLYNRSRRRIKMKELSAIEEVHQFIQSTELGLIYVLTDS